MKTIKALPAESQSPLRDFVTEYKGRRENEFDALPLDQQVVRLKETVAYLARRCEAAESSCVIANTTARNLHGVIAERDAWATFFCKWVDYHHGSGESDRAWEAFLVETEQIGPSPGPQEPTR